jgi:hypothetical protein
MSSAPSNLAEPLPDGQPCADEAGAASDSRFDLILVGTLVTLLLHPPAPAFVMHYLQGAAVCGILWRGIRQHPHFWLALAAAQGAYLWLDWHWADNHKYLAVYWCLALWVSLVQADRERATIRLRTTSRLILGLVMLLATGWKLASSEYRDGSFFEFTLLADGRFATKAAWLLGMDPEALAQNRQLVAELQASGASLAPVKLASSPRVELAAQVFTWSTMAIEGLLAALFLIPGRGRWWPAARDWVLLVFLLGTYLIAPVFGFGGLLAVIGAAQAESTRRQTALLAMLAVLEVFGLAFL